MNIQPISNNISNQLNLNAVNNVELANSLVNVSNLNSAVNKSILENAAATIVNAANTTIQNAGNVLASTQVTNNIIMNGNKSGNSVTDVTNNMAVSGLNLANSASFGKVSAKAISNASINATVKVTANSSMSNGVNKVVNSVINEAAKIESVAVTNSVKANIKAINSVVNLAGKTNNTQTKEVLINAAASIQTNTNKMINRIQPYNNSVITLSKPKPAGKGFLITASGNTVKLNNKNLQRITNPESTKKYVAFNGKNKKLSTQVYKQGELRNVYKNKKGVYTKAAGMSGNVKNYLYSGMNTGLFGNSML